MAAGPPITCVHGNNGCCCGVLRCACRSVVVQWVSGGSAPQRVRWRLADEPYSEARTVTSTVVGWSLPALQPACQAASTAPQAIAFGALQCSIPAFLNLVRFDHTHHHVYGSTGMASGRSLYSCTHCAQRTVPRRLTPPLRPVPHPGGAQSTYGRDDMCGFPANSTGWLDPGILHMAVLPSAPPNGLVPSTRYAFTYGSEVCCVSLRCCVQWGRFGSSVCDDS